MTLAETLKIRLPETQSQLDLLLTEHIDAQETTLRGGGTSEDSTWGLAAPATWTPDHAELHNLLVVYRQFCRSLEQTQAAQQPEWTTVRWRHSYWHLAQWYLLCSRRRVQGCRGCGSQTREKERHTHQRQRFDRDWIIISARDTRTDPERVLEGLQWLDRGWEQHVYPRLKRGPQLVAWEKLLAS